MDPQKVIVVMRETILAIELLPERLRRQVDLDYYRRQLAQAEKAAAQRQ